jgi:Protein of unknown function (DUF3309)
VFDVNHDALCQLRNKISYLSVIGRLAERTFAVPLAVAETDMSTILIIVLILILIGALPRWPHSSGWGYGPSGGVGLIVLILIVLLLTGRI